MHFAPIYRGPIGIKKIRAIFFPGTLRCDTLVNWAFQQGTGQPLVTGVVLPTYVFLRRNLLLAKIIRHKWLDPRAAGHADS